MVHADAYSRLVLAAYLQEGQQALFDALQLSLVLLVGVFQLLERAGRIDVVAGIDAHLLAVLCGHVGHTGVEVNVGHERLRVAVVFQPGRDVAHVLSLARALRGETHQLAACVDDALGLSHRALRIVGVGGGH